MNAMRAVRWTGWVGPDGLLLTLHRWLKRAIRLITSPRPRHGQQMDLSLVTASKKKKKRERERVRGATISAGRVNDSVVFHSWSYYGGRVRRNGRLSGYGWPWRTHRSIRKERGCKSHMCSLCGTWYFITCRNKDVNTSFIPNFSRMKPNSTISKVWRLKKRSTRSSGVNARAQPTSSYRLMVPFLIRVSSVYFLLLLPIDKTIKLWKVFEKSLKVVAESHLDTSPTPDSPLRIPKLLHRDTIIAAVPRRTFANGTGAMSWEHCM